MQLRALQISALAKWMMRVDEATQETGIKTFNPFTVQVDGVIVNISTNDKGFLVMEESL